MRKSSWCWKRTTSNWVLLQFHSCWYSLYQLRFSRRRKTGRCCILTILLQEIVQKIKQLNKKGRLEQETEAIVHRQKFFREVSILYLSPFNLLSPTHKDYLDISLDNLLLKGDWLWVVITFTQYPHSNTTQNCVCLIIGTDSQVRLT
jgi:hypothetical protein